MDNYSINVISVAQGQKNGIICARMLALSVRVTNEKQIRA
jgi:hypothetical protein